MLPSRGLRTLNQAVQLSRRSINVSRQFSSGGLPLRTRWQSQPSNPLTSSVTSSRSRILCSGFMIPSLSATARFQSTATPPPPPAPADATSVTSPVTNASTPSIQDLDLNPSATDSLSALMHQSAQGIHNIGDLKALGIEFGYGPTSLIEWLLEHVHVYSGMPWWGSIIATTLIVRVALLKPAITGSDTSARMQALRPYLQPLEDKMQKAKTPEERQIATQEWRQAMDEAGVSMFNVMKPMLWQMVMGFASFRLLRAMAALPVPGLQDGGFLWLHDLTQADPYFGLPLLTAGLLHLTLRMGGEQGVQALTAKMRSFMLYGFPALAVPLSGFLPGVLQVSFATAAVWGILQSYLIRQPAVRARLGLAPIIKPTAATTTSIPRPTLNLAPSYSPPTPVREPEPEATGILGGAKKEFRGAMKEASEKLAQWRGNKERKGGRSKAFLEQAESYEKRKQKEMAEERRRGGRWR